MGGAAVIPGFTSIIRGISGEPELSRVVGFVGGLAYIVGAHGFIIASMAMGQPFDLTAYCLVFPSGLAAVTTGTAAAVAIKDRNVAQATVTAQNVEGQV